MGTDERLHLSNNIEIYPGKSVAVLQHSNCSWGLGTVEFVNGQDYQIRCDKCDKKVVLDVPSMQSRISESKKL